MLPFFLTAPAVILEVMDKEASVTAMWIGATVIGMGGFFLGRYRYWLAFPFLALGLLLAWVQIGELNDPSVGPHILREAGPSYWTHSYVSFAFMLLLPAIGAVVGWARTGKRAT